MDLQIDEDEGEDLLRSLQAELRRRERGNAVRLEVSGNAPQDSLNWLLPRAGPRRQARRLRRGGAAVPGRHQRAAAPVDERRDLRDEAFLPQYVPPLRDGEDIFETITARDVLLHHPYESFEAVIDFMSQAAEDPRVLAIKQTLYRTGGDSPIGARARSARPSWASRSRRWSS